MSSVFRTERTYVLGSARARRLEREVAARLAACRHEGAHECHVRTVYLDTADGRLAREIVENPSRSTKLRVRSYGAGAPPGDGPVWVEVKHRRGLVVAKTRFETTRAALSALLRGGAVAVTAAQAEFARVRGLRGLVPTVVVDYRRRSYESADGALRLTFDAGVVARRVAADYLSRPRLEAASAEPWSAVGDDRVFEIKRRGSVERTPPWLVGLLRDERPDGFSKAAAALRALAVEPPAAVYGAEI